MSARLPSSPEVDRHRVAVDPVLGCQLLGGGPGLIGGHQLVHLLRSQVNPVPPGRSRRFWLRAGLSVSEGLNNSGDDLDKRGGAGVREESAQFHSITPGRGYLRWDSVTSVTSVTASGAVGVQ